jgi:hypothetical protein
MKPQVPGVRRALAATLSPHHPCPRPHCLHLPPPPPAVLAKTDLAIASRYADLVPDPAVRSAVFNAISEEHARTVSAVLRIKGISRLLEDQPELERSISARFPYADPLNHLQVRSERLGGRLESVADGLWCCEEAVAHH